MKFPEERWIEWMDHLADHDYVIVDNFISDEDFILIREYFNKMEEADLLKKAGIGAYNEQQIISEVRGDYIYWLDAQKDSELSPFFEMIDELSQKLKRYCFISLSGSEFHLAHYPAGSRYEKHLDHFSEQSNRQITVLIYLNDKWEKSHGGELKVYSEDGDFLVEPIAKRLLIFKSDCVEHEVLLTHKDRYSLSGWLLHKPTALKYLIK